MLVLIILGVYLLVINPISIATKKKEEEEKNDGKIESGETVAGFDYGLVTDEFIDELEKQNKTEVKQSTPSYTL